MIQFNKIFIQLENQGIGHHYCPDPDLLCKIETEDRVTLALSRILATVVGERQGARQLLQGEGIQKVLFKMRLGEDDSPNPSFE